MVRAGGEAQLTDEFVGCVVEAVRPIAWTATARRGACRSPTIVWSTTGCTTTRLTVRKVHDLLGRRGVVVPERTLHRYALEVCGIGRSHRATTVRVADGQPGDELKVDFGKLGRIPDGDRQRDCGG